MKLFYREYGHGATNLVILHGLLGSSRNWHTLATRLAERYRVVVPDLRNHGDSPHGEHSVDSMRQDVLDLLVDLDLTPVWLLGHSMGGLVAMEFAFRHPERLVGLIVEDIAPVSRLNRLEWIFQALESLNLHAVTSRTDADRALQSAIPDTGVRQFLLQNLQRQPDGRFTWRCNLPELHRFVRETRAYRAPADARYSGPTLFVGGANSEVRLADQETRIAAHFPHYRLVMLPNARHWVHFDAPEAFLRTVTGFIEANT